MTTMTTKKIVKKTKSKVMGRPRIKIDWKRVEDYCNIFCTGEEIASLLKIDYDTLMRSLKKKGYATFADYYKKFSGQGKESLRRAQYKAAVYDANSALLIWMGKQFLGQTDKAGDIYLQNNVQVNADFGWVD